MPRPALCDHWRQRRLLLDLMSQRRLREGGLFLMPELFAVGLTGWARAAICLEHKGLLARAGDAWRLTENGQSYGQRLLEDEAMNGGQSPEPAWREAFGLRLEDAREQRGLTKAEVARHMQVSRSAVGQWESGRAVPTLGALLKLGAMMAVTYDWLLRGVGPMRRNETEAA